jgi:EGF-like domain
MIEPFHLRPSPDMISMKKTIRYLLYSRSNDSLIEKRSRYFNRSMIIDHHPYSVRIEAYELQVNDEKPRLAGVWLYPIYFDFLPNFRLAKVLYLTRLDESRDPCLSSPCAVHQECHRLLNEPSHFVCLCQPMFSGTECSIQDRLCQDNFCGSNALCKPDYRSLVRGNDRLPYCLCPLSRLGDRCQLNYDLCDRNPCLNNGICLPTSQLNSYFCSCTEEYYGNECHLTKHAVHLRINEHADDRVALVQYFDINFITLDLMFAHQHLHDSLPQSLFYLHEQTKKAPAVIVVKLYSNTQIDIYLISLQIEVESIEGTTELSERNRCPHVNTLLPIQKGAFVTKYRYTDDDMIAFRDISYPIPLSLSTEQ